MTREEIDLFEELVETADQHFDGHLTILKFTTNWRVSFETPVDNDFSKFVVGETFGEAATNALVASEETEIHERARQAGQRGS